MDMEADTRCKAACQMKQQQEAFQILLSSHLVHLLSYRTITEACVQLHELHSTSPSPYASAVAQPLSLPPPPTPPLDHVSPPPIPLPRIRSSSPLHSTAPS